MTDYEVTPPPDRLADRDAAGGHDITEEGLYRDSYRDGENIRIEEV